jgi:hypothetical protein
MRNFPRLVTIILYVQILIFFSILIVQSLYMIPRWDLLEQISVADRLSAGGEMFPAPDNSILGGITPYFPGVAVVAYVLMEIINHSYIVIVMLCIASATTFWFISMQKTVVLSFDRYYDARNFWPVMIIMAALICKDWFAYAVEFKPDTLAYLIGAISVGLSLKLNRSLLVTFLLGVLAGSALIFKQQYAAFILGYFTYVAVTRQVRDIIFLLGMCASVASVVFYIVHDPSLVFWTISTFSDDKFLAPYEWVKLHIRFGTYIGLSVLGFFVLSYFNQLHLQSEKLRSMAQNSWKNPFFWLIGSSLCAAFISSWKDGGNAGNTEFGFILLSPIFLLIFEKSSRKILLIISTIVLCAHLPKVVKLKDRLADTYKLKSVVEALPSNKCEGLVVGSNVYFAVRDKYRGCDYQNYWSHAAKEENTDGADVIHKFMSEQVYSLFVVENFSAIEQMLSADDRTKIIFKNDIGVIAVRN